MQHLKAADPLGPEQQHLLTRHGWHLHTTHMCCADVNYVLALGDSPNLRTGLDDVVDRFRRTHEEIVHVRALHRFDVRRDIKHVLVENLYEVRSTNFDCQEIRDITAGIRPVVAGSCDKLTLDRCVHGPALDRLAVALAWSSHGAQYSTGFGNRSGPTRGCLAFHLGTMGITPGMVLQHTLENWLESPYSQGCIETLGWEVAMTVFTASSADDALAVSVGAGSAARVRLSAAAVSVSDEELTNRIIRLSTLAVLQHQASTASPPRSEAQVAAYASTIDF